MDPPPTTTTSRPAQEPDPFDTLLTLENDFYREGYEAGVTDSAHAGLIEGKIFGIEKGFEKALEIGRARGRAIVWLARLNGGGETTNGDVLTVDGGEVRDVSGVMSGLPSLQENARLRKHVDVLLSLTDPTNLPKDNSDESVGEVDERITKIRARLKMISNMIGESVSSSAAARASIEESGGLNARH